jgi:hypothetical protein
VTTSLQAALGDADDLLGHILGEKSREEQGMGWDRRFQIVFVDNC